MLNNYTDIETLPEPNGLQKFIDLAKDSIKVPSNLTKPKLISALGYGDDAKYKTVDELKLDWIEKFGGEQAKIQGEENWRKTSFDGSKGEICVICSAIGDGEVQSFSQQNVTEAQMLREYWEWLGDMARSNQWWFVAHNAKFDVPFLWHRSVINNVKPLRFNPHGRHNQSHYCTMERWVGFGGRISMDNLAKALGLHGKGDMDGSVVYDTWLQDPQKVIEYCRDDVHMLREIYNRLEFV